MTRRPVTIRRFDEPRLVINGRVLDASQAERLKAFTEQVLQAQETRRLAETPAGRVLVTAADRAMAKRVERAGVRGLSVLAEELAAAAAADQADADLTETVANRRLLGDEIERGPGGVTRIATSDGVGFAASRGKLDGLPIPAKRLVEVGQLYRACFEATSAMLTPERNEVRGSGGGGVQDAIVAAGQTLAILRLRQTAAHVRALDSVCGHDMTPHRAAIRLGYRQATVEKWLRDGLVTAAENWGTA